MTLKYIKLNDDAFSPVKTDPLSAGFDLRSSIDAIVPPGFTQLIETGLSIEVPVGCYGRIAARSGLALNHSIHIGGGVLDRSYRGPVGIIVHNLSARDEFHVRRGDRVAQLICEKITQPVLLEVEKLETTERAAKGFGSSGVK